MSGHHFTEAEATDETMLLLTRKLRRLHPEVFADLWAKLPEGARRTIHAAENRADLLRVRTDKTWAPSDLDDVEE